jgi:hypothetical protein
LLPQAVRACPTRGRRAPNSGLPGRVCARLYGMAEGLEGVDERAGDEPNQTPATPEPASKSLKEFLETVPPGRGASVTDALSAIPNRSPLAYTVKACNLQLHCDGSKCGGIRTFAKLKGDEHIPTGADRHPVYVRYRCKNCETAVKLYSLLVSAHSSGACAMYKLAEIPNFGGSTPAKVITLIREEREYYVKGRRSENQGLGIAAFAYYRRVVERQKDRILDEVIKASRKVSAPEEMIARLDEAKRETQFSKAMESLKPSVPQALLIEGQNPLILLHNALSEGLHAQTDADCLELATSIRLVLTELVDRMATVLSDHAELKAAVTKLMGVKAKKGMSRGRE